MSKTSLYGMRRDYSPEPLKTGEMDPDPILQFAAWFQQAKAKENTEVNAAALATTGKDLMPSARMVLLKSFSEKGFVFFTNYMSKKGRQMAENNRAALLLFWPVSARQIRIEGYVEKIDAEESDTYFSERPAESRASAILSRQSDVLEDKAAFGNEVKSIAATSLTGKRPEHWGGYLLVPVSMEFWQGNLSRNHDRFHYSLENGSWIIRQLYP